MGSRDVGNTYAHPVFHMYGNSVAIIEGAGMTYDPWP